MTRCLRRQALFVVSQGEGLPWQRSHLMRCHRCAERYRELVGASELAARILREGPLPERVPQPRSVLRPWPVAVLAATGLALALVWRGVPGGWPPQATVMEEADEDAGLSLAHVSEFAFAADEFDAPSDADGTYLEAALDGEWPCEHEDGTPDPECGDEF